MPLSVGERLGPYEILAPLGAGGMGEVYRARDTKLERDVAIKVLPAALAQDPERLARFEREAKVLAALNHPNIAQIYGSEQRALVMELVEGETLKGPLPIETALDYARQIADALETAHEKGITHRDLKPANIMITPTGVVKVLDFGLAAVAQDPAAGSTDPSNSPTLTMRATQAGMIMGTAAYMSPEQAAGKPVDKRADIWSFGVVLFELLTGRQLFGEGETISHTLADVLRAPIDFDKLPKETPRATRDLLRRCLDRDVKNRLRDIGEARIILENTESGSEVPRQAESFPTRRAWPSIAGLLVAVLAVLAFVHFREKPPAEHTLRYNIPVPENSALHSFAVSPDGRFVTFAAAINGKQQLWLRPLDALQAQPVPTTDDASYPFWSPDSRYIGFFAQGKLKKVAVNGGPAQPLSEANGARGGSWNRDGVILFAVAGGQIQRVPASGGTPTDVLKPGGVFRYPLFLPDGRHFLYTDIRPNTAGIYIGSLDGGENRRVLADPSSAVFAPFSPESHAGHLLFVRENSVMAMPFDAETSQVSGDILPVAEGVRISGANAGYAPVSASASDVLMYSSGDVGGYRNQAWWYDGAGKQLGPIGAPGDVFMPAISPDEKMVAFVRAGGGNSDIWLRDLVRATDMRLTPGGSNVAPIWSPKGERIAFTSRGPFGSLFQKAASGSGEAELLLSAVNVRADQWSRDGRFIVFTRIDPKTRLDLWVLPMGGGVAADRKPVKFLDTESNESQGQLSPDSQWMAYTSDESSAREVYVRPFPSGEGKWKISTAGGEQPRWRGDGKKLFYLAADGKLTAVDVKAVAGPKPSFIPGVPVPLFDSHIFSSATNTNDVFQYDVTADGKRFLVMVNTAGVSSPPLTVVMNWQAGLKQ